MRDPELFAPFDAVLAAYRPTVAAVETGVVEQIGQGIARVSGLPGVAAMELVRFPDRILGIAFNLDPEEVGVVLLGGSAIYGPPRDARGNRSLAEGKVAAIYPASC
jgi:F-type H+/Na+-transporting ATPase subunit alpha